MKQHIYKLTITVVLVLASILSCNKKLDTTDQNNPTISSYFKTAAELQNGVNGIYSILRGGALVGREWFFTHDMRGGETNAGGAQLEAPRAELLKQPMPAPSNSVMTSVWQGTYEMINRANVVLAKAPGVTDNTTLRDRLVGETKFQLCQCLTIRYINIGVAGDKINAGVVGGVRNCVSCKCIAVILGSEDAVERSAKRPSVIQLFSKAKYSCGFIKFCFKFTLAYIIFITGAFSIINNILIVLNPVGEA